MPFDSQQPSLPGNLTGGTRPGPAAMYRRLLSKYGPDPTGFNPTPMTPKQREEISLVSWSNPEPNWVTLEVNAQERIVPVLPGDDATFVSQSTVVTSGEFTSKLWCRARFHRHGIGRTVVFDIGPGMRISQNCSSAQLTILPPPEYASSAAAFSPATLSGPGEFLETVIVGTLTKSFSAYKGRATLTKSFRLGGAGDPVLPTTIYMPLPSAAESLQIGITDAVGNGWPVTSPFGSFVESPTSPSIFDLEQLTIAANRTGDVTIPKNASGVRTTVPTAVLVPTIVTYIWGLEF